MMTTAEIEYYEQTEALAASTGHDLGCFEITGELQDIEHGEDIAEYIRTAVAEGTFKCHCDYYNSDEEDLA